MSRAPRFTYPRAVHHVTMRCNNREFLFADPWFDEFFQTVQRARPKFGLLLYNFCLMTNHVHLFFKVPACDTLSESMHWIANTFSRRFNKAMGRNGHLWEGRFRSTIVDETAYFFRCMAYLDLNPVRAGIVKKPIEYRWCGHRALRHEDIAVLDMHPLYVASAPDAACRYALYLKALREEAVRPPVPLAREHFIGSRRFVGRMVKKFGLEGDSYVRRRALDLGLECAGSRLGGRPSRA